MPKFQFTKALCRLKAALSPDALKLIGIETRFLVRQRAITPVNLVPSLTMTSWPSTPQPTFLTMYKEWKS